MSPTGRRTPAASICPVILPAPDGETEPPRGPTGRRITDGATRPTTRRSPPGRPIIRRRPRPVETGKGRVAALLPKPTTLLLRGGRRDAMKHGSSKSRGMTLVELVIAVLLTAVIAIAVGTFSSNLFRTDASLEADYAPANQANIALAAIYERV